MRKPLAATSNTLPVLASIGKKPMKLRERLRRRPQPRPVIVMENSDFQRLADSPRGTRLALFPISLSQDIAKGDSVYAEGASRKTVLREGRQYRVGAVVHRIESVIDPDTNDRRISIVVEHTILMLTEEDLKRLPRPGHIQFDR